MGKYDKFRQIRKIEGPPDPYEEDRQKAVKELLAFDWLGRKGAFKTPFKPHYIFMPSHKETIYERKKRMIDQLSLACCACSMCELGRKNAVRYNTGRDPHVLSNCNPTPFMVVGQNPGWDELKERQPFVGAAGKNFDNEIAKHGLSRDDFYICNTVRCLRYNSKVLLADGRYVNVATLVREQYDGKVACVVNNQRTTRKVIGWYKSPIGNRGFFRLSYVYAAKNWNDRLGIDLTEGHLVLTDDGYRKVEELVDLSCKVCTGTLAPDEVGEQVLLGSLLGDGNIQPQQGFVETHCLQQESYLLWKSQILQYLEYSNSRGISIQSGVQTHFARLYIKGCPYLRWLRSLFYSGKKHVPSYVLQNLSPLGLAIWYQDDGNLVVPKNRRKSFAIIATCSFTAADVSYLIDMLRTRFNIEATIFFQQGPRIRIPARSLQKFQEIICPYIHESMNYKLLPQYRNRTVELKSRATLFFDHAIIEERQYPDTSVYCLDVEEAHNFITHGGVVHNCYTEGNARPSEEHKERCEPFLKIEIQLIRPLLVIALGAVAFSQLCPDSDFSDSLKKITKSKKYKVNVFPVYHPSPLNFRGTGRKEAFAEQIRLMCKLVKRLKQNYSENNSASDESTIVE